MRFNYRIFVFLLLFMYLRTRRFPDNKINKLFGSIVLFSLLVECYVTFVSVEENESNFYILEQYINGILYFYLLSIISQSDISAGLLILPYIMTLITKNKNSRWQTGIIYIIYLAYYFYSNKKDKELYYKIFILFIILTLCVINFYIIDFPILINVICLLKVILIFVVSYNVKLEMKLSLDK